MSGYHLLVVSGRPDAVRVVSGRIKFSHHLLTMNLLAHRLDFSSVVQFPLANDDGLMLSVTSSRARSLTDRITIGLTLHGRVHHLLNILVCMIDRFIAPVARSCLSLLLVYVIRFLG